MAEEAAAAVTKWCVSADLTAGAEPILGNYTGRASNNANSFVSTAFP